MKQTLNKIYACLLFLPALLYISCTGQQQSQSPAGYDLNKPVKYNMPGVLTEISGITFAQGNADVMYAEQDEDGVLFSFKPGSRDTRQVRFGSSGDYEDVAISNGMVIMLRSDGTLFTFPLADTENAVVPGDKQKGLLPKGEYEGLYADTNGSVYALCKHCSIEKTSKTTTVFTLKIAANGRLTNSGQNTIDVKKIEELTGVKKLAFHPSALAKNPQTSEWYILSSVNKMLVATDANWNVKEVFRLNPAVFGQPEGMTFDKDNNLYISNEGDKLRPGNVLKFTFKK